jgi:hypothetical protein
MILFSNIAFACSNNFLGIASIPQGFPTKLKIGQN